jgi:hypothetical protein
MKLSLFRKRQSPQDIEREVHEEIEKLVRSGQNPPPPSWTLSGGLPLDESSAEAPAAPAEDGSPVDDAQPAATGTDDVAEVASAPAPEAPSVEASSGVAPSPAAPSPANAAARPATAPRTAKRAPAKTAKSAKTATRGAAKSAKTARAASGGRQTPGASRSGRTGA